MSNKLSLMETMIVSLSVWTSCQDIKDNFSKISSSIESTIAKSPMTLCNTNKEFPSLLKPQGSLVQRFGVNEVQIFIDVNTHWLKRITKEQLKPFGQLSVEFAQAFGLKEHFCISLITEH
ncbi:hypothetical protein WICPIJ_008531 [Wickerhamomyces pijperi]|uniref:Uncharacterized protein n=1 Tax=Wickerhamomyces pijperi TaxID=599730 RepID=A0A9P8PY75_WICPI|nr:hypothetical protein WICPIJ_008531 [Wickerhamomyces pijperi]